MGRDWNHNGRRDSYDRRRDYRDYQLFKQVVLKDSEEKKTSNRLMNSYGNKNEEGSLGKTIGCFGCLLFIVSVLCMFT